MKGGIGCFCVKLQLDDDVTFKQLVHHPLVVAKVLAKTVAAETGFADVMATVHRVLGSFPLRPPRWAQERGQRWL